MKIKYSLLLATLITTLISANTNAAVVVDWDLDGMAGTEASKAANSASTGILGKDLTRGAGLTGNAGGNSINAKGWNNQSTDYFSFGFDVANGYKVNLSNLVIGSKSSNTGPGALGLYYSGDNFSSRLYTFNEASTYNSTSATTAFLNSTIDLSALQNLSGSVEFRIAQIGTAAANGGATNSSSGTFRIAEYYNGSTFTNLQLNGETLSTVPVPGAVWLMGSGLMGLVGAARKSRKTA